MGSRGSNNSRDVSFSYAKSHTKQRNTTQWHVLDLGRQGSYPGPTPKQKLTNTNTALPMVTACSVGLVGWSGRLFWSEILELYFWWQFFGEESHSNPDLT
jgi:hypothetical protein